MNDVLSWMKRYDVNMKAYINPLGAPNERYYKGGIMFACVRESTKSLQKRDVIAAGGRYDSLVREFRPRMTTQSEDRHVVGFSLGWERLTMMMAKSRERSDKKFLKRTEEEPEGQWSARRVCLV